MEIGILGLTFHSGNKGCEALSYSFLELLNDIATKYNDTITVDFITILPTKKWIKSGFSGRNLEPMYFPLINYSNLRFRLKFFIYKMGKVVFLNDISKCKFVIDYTAGDSFTDIYGEERFYSRTRVKKKVIDSGIPFVLGSQTIGPFNNSDVERLAVEVINKSLEVYARDEQSRDYTKKISGREPILTTDIAFALPYHNVEIIKTGRKKIGFNPSGLLWDGGYTKNNQFGLKVDYPEYCRGVIRELLSRDYEVFLIPHAFSTTEVGLDNDYTAVTELKKEFPACKIVSDLITPMDAKSYIAKMDAFIGARMHATIAAFSSGVPVIPFSYSRKFEGLFESLGYNYVIHGKTESTEEATSRTLNYIEHVNDLKREVDAGKILTESSNRFIESELERLVYKS